jgi:hypothetical protein
MAWKACWEFSAPKEKSSSPRPMRKSRAAIARCSRSRLVANAAAEGRSIGGSAAQSTARSPFHGYYFKILSSQGRAAAGGARSYVTDGRMTGGFALVAWPARYGVTGIMTFAVNQDDTLHEKDLGPETATNAEGMKIYDPDDTWTIVPR